MIPALKNVNNTDFDPSAFSTVIADNQFSTLGIVLMAALARLSKITGISREMKIQTVVPKIKKPSPVIVKEDLGERIRRVDDVPMTRPKASQSAEEVPSKEKPEKERASKSTKKTKKKKNAIDDLFSGLF
jgi:ribonuclease MRP protein subunit RMP1